MKRSSFSNKMRQSLSDITNFQSPEELNPHNTGLETSEQVNRLLKENAALVKLLEERDKTIENSRYELRKHREGISKLRVQNWSLAQTNSQFLAEINLARNKVKALQHEVTSKSALLKAKCYELEKCEKTKLRNSLAAENVGKIENEELVKPFVPNRRRFIRSKSLGSSTPDKIESKTEKSEPKRRQMRKKSTRVRSAREEVTEILFEIKDLQLTMPNDTCQQDESTIASCTRKKEEEEKDLRRREGLIRYRDCMIRQSPVYRASAERTPS